MSLIFKGKVPVEDDKISYEIIIKFSSGVNKITDRFLFTIDKNIWICALENVSSIVTGKYAKCRPKNNWCEWSLKTSTSR